MHPPARLYLLLLTMAMAVVDEAANYKVLPSSRDKRNRCEREGYICLKKDFLCDGAIIEETCNEDYICCDDSSDPYKDNSCDWSMETNFQNPPLILKESANRIILPEGENRIIRFEHGESFWIACHNSKFRLEWIADEEYFNLLCLKNHIFVIFKETMESFDYPFESLGCKKPVTSNVEKTNKDCGHVNGNVGGNNRGLTHEIGFKVHDKFSPLIKVCFDQSLQTTLWTEHKLRGKNLAARRAYGKSRSFRKGEFFTDIDMKNTYTGKGQKERMRDLGLDEIRKDFIDSYRNYLQRGHLSPIGDFVTTAEMDATNLFTNILPQWEQVNTGNWGILEDEIRLYAEKNRQNLKIISGGYETMTIKTKKEIKKIFIAKMKGGTYEDYVPVPKYLWKVVIVNKKSGIREAVAFVIINNPYIVKKPHHTQLLCKDICDDLVWLNDSDRLNGFNRYLRREITYGYTYCCKVDALKLKIPTIPDEVDGVVISDLEIFKK